MFKIALASALSLATFAGASTADEVTDTLNSALAAYEDGDIQYALEELDFAKQLMNTMKGDALSGFLPDAPDGWSRTDSAEMGAGLAFMGGGVGAEAEYNNGNETITITITANNPMIAAMAGMMGNAAAMGIPLVRVGREKFMNQDGDLTAMIGNQVMVQASGGDVDTMVDLLKSMDLRGLGNFGS